MRKWNFSLSMTLSALIILTACSNIDTPVPVAAKAPAFNDNFISMGADERLVYTVGVPAPEGETFAKARHGKLQISPLAIKTLKPAKVPLPKAEVQPSIHLSPGIKLSRPKKVNRQPMNLANAVTEGFLRHHLDMVLVLGSLVAIWLVFFSKKRYLS